MSHIPIGNRLSKVCVLACAFIGFESGNSTCAFGQKEIPQVDKTENEKPKYLTQRECLHMHEEAEAHVFQLFQANVIEPGARGQVKKAIPLFGEYSQNFLIYYMKSCKLEHRLSVSF